jgi:hypothetical protein
MTRIEDLGVGDSFKTESGKRIYTIIDIMFSKELDKNVWLLNGGFYVSNPDKVVIREER